MVKRRKPPVLKALHLSSRKPSSSLSSHSFPKQTLARTSHTSMPIVLPALAVFLLYVVPSRHVYKVNRETSATTIHTATIENNVEPETNRAQHAFTSNPQSAEGSSSIRNKDNVCVGGDKQEKSTESQLSLELC